MSDYLGAQEDINEARQCISAAVTEGRDIRLEGPAEDAYHYLEAANGWLRENQPDEAAREITDALDRLHEHVDLPGLVDRAREGLQQAIAILSSVLEDLR
jgi:hypothetical protein